MIDLNTLISIGRIIKPHGVNGEMVVMVDADICWEELQCIFLMMDGLPVPFFIMSSRPKSSETDLITLDGITNEKEAAVVCGKTVYAEQSKFEDDTDDSEAGFYADDLIGFNAMTDDGRTIGEITALDTTTANVLFVIESVAGEQILIPAADEFIIGMDREKKKVKFSLPTGLID